MELQLCKRLLEAAAEKRGHPLVARIHRCLWHFGDLILLGSEFREQNLSSWWNPVSVEGFGQPGSWLFVFPFFDGHRLLVLAAPTRAEENSTLPALDSILLYTVSFEL